MRKYMRAKETKAYPPSPPLLPYPPRVRRRAKVSELMDAMASRPKYRKGFSRKLVGSHIHVLLAMADQEGWNEGGGGGSGGSSGGSGGDPGGDGFDCDSLERCIDEFFHEVSTGRGGWTHSLTCFFRALLTCFPSISSRQLVLWSTSSLTILLSVLVVGNTVTVKIFACGMGAKTTLQH